MSEYYFRFPPITALTIPQQAALNEPEPIALSGTPGTGKSVVGLYRHMRNVELGRQSLLMTYTSSLKTYLASCCRPHNATAAMDIKTSLGNRPESFEDWEEIIIDEAQDLDADFYKGLDNQFCVSYSADDSQILYPDHCCRQAKLRELFPDNVEYVLSENFRSTLRIMQFAKVAFPKAYIPRAILDSLIGNPGGKPTYLISGGCKYDYSNTRQDNAICDIIRSLTSDSHNIAILVPWRNEARYFDATLKANGFSDTSVYYSDENRFPDGATRINSVHVTTFKSAKGLEFDTVIMPNFDTHYNLMHGRGYNYSWEDLYVAATRARSNLYLIGNGKLPCIESVVDKHIL